MTPKDSPLPELLMLIAKQIGRESAKHAHSKSFPQRIDTEPTPPPSHNTEDREDSS